MAESGFPSEEHKIFLIYLYPPVFDYTFDNISWRGMQILDSAAGSGVDLRASSVIGGAVGRSDKAGSGKGSFLFSD